jgi:hypothetical protein
MDSPAAPSMRQIAYEVEQTLHAQLAQLLKSEGRAANRTP